MLAAPSSDFAPLLLDTHVLIWLSTNPGKIPPLLLQAIDNATHRFVSHVSALEVQLKHLKDSENFPFSLRHFDQTMKEFACTEMPITVQDIRALEYVKSLHSDPFDRLLMAQASGRNVFLASLDKDIQRSFEASKAFSLFSDRARPGATSGPS